MTPEGERAMDEAREGRLGGAVDRLEGAEGRLAELEA